MWAIGRRKWQNAPDGLKRSSNCPRVVKKTGSLRLDSLWGEITANPRTRQAAMFGSGVLQLFHSVETWLMQGLPHGFTCLSSLQQLLPWKSHLRRPFKCIFSFFLSHSQKKLAPRAHTQLSGLNPTTLWGPVQPALSPAVQRQSEDRIKSNVHSRVREGRTMTYRK